jgi:pilus assembly protein CpaE
MSERSLRGALISPDGRFRSEVRALLGDVEPRVGIAVEISERFVDFREDVVRTLRQSKADLLLVDLEQEPELGVKFIQFLADAQPGHRVIAFGGEISPDQLLTAMRAGVADYLHKPVSAELLRGAVGRVAQTLSSSRVKAEEESKAEGQVFAFFSPKGGSGSTTVATNLAVVLRQLTSKRTLLVDLDLELGETALMLGMRPRFNFVDLVQNFHRMDADLLASFIERHDSGVDLLSAPYHPEKAEMVSGDLIRRILLFLRQHYDYVVVDTSKSFSQATLATFEQADQVFLVTTADLPSLRNIQRGLPMMRRVLVRGEDQLRLVINRFDPKDQISAKDIERSLGLKVFWKLSNDYEAVLGSLNTGKPIVMNGTSSYSKDLKNLGVALAGTEAQTERRGRIMGALSRFTTGKKKDGKHG